MARKAILSISFNRNGEINSSNPERENENWFEVESYRKKPCNKIITIGIEVITINIIKDFLFKKLCCTSTYY